MSKNNIIKFSNTTKRITLPKKIATTNPEGKKKQIKATIDRLNRASCSSKNLQKNKKCKCDQLGPTKQLINEQNDCKKYIKWMIKYLMKKNKSASKNTNKQLRKTDMTTFYKMQKLVTAKKCNTHFVITERKKNIKTHEKK